MVLTDAYTLQIPRFHFPNLFQSLHPARFGEASEHFAYEIIQFAAIFEIGELLAVGAGGVMFLDAAFPNGTCVESAAGLAGFASTLSAGAAGGAIEAAICDHIIRIIGHWEL